MKIIRNYASNLYDYCFSLLQRRYLRNKEIKLEKLGILMCNPKRIKYRTHISKMTRVKKFNILFFKFIKPLFSLLFRNKITIISGSWDHEGELTKIEQTEHYQAFYNHFIKGLNWEKTQYFKNLLDGINTGQTYFYDSKKKLIQRFKEYDTLYDKIKRKGYKTQLELMQSEGFFDSMGRFSKVRKINDEISIAIDRIGNPIVLDGIHRLIISKVLGLELVPVSILVFHKNFLV